MLIKKLPKHISKTLNLNIQTFQTMNHGIPNELGLKCSFFAHSPVTRNPPDFDWENSRDTVVYCTYLSGPSSVYCLCLTWWFYFPNFLIIKSHNKSTQQIFMMPTFTTDSEKGRYRGS